jgi:hypothetical protein
MTLTSLAITALFVLSPLYAIAVIAQTLCDHSQSLERILR